MDDLHDAIYKIFFGDDRQPSEEAAKFTEAQWPEAGDPRLLLDFLRDKISNRQLNLFAVACCRRAWQLLTRPSQAAIEATERFVDGYLSDEQQGFAALAAIDTEVGIMVHQMDAPRHDPQDAALVQRLSAAATAVTYGLCPAPVIGTYTPDTPEQDRGMMALVSHITVAITGRASDPTEFRVQADFLRDIVGNPFHPFVLDPSWQTPTVISLAQAIYAERAFDRMPMLADALEESGCAHEDILQHCRGPGLHVRGCCVLDLLLAGRFPAPGPAEAFVEIPPIHKRKEEYPVGSNERCYRCRFRCSTCGPRLILLYPGDDNPAQLQECPFCDFGDPSVTVDRLEPFGQAEWLAGDDWESMCRWVDDHFGHTKIGKLAVLRKSRLFACQCCRFLWPALPHPDSRAAVEVAEQFAERATTKAELQGAFKKANAAAWSAGGSGYHPAWAANTAAYDTPSVDSAASQLLAHVKSSEAEYGRAEKLIVAWLWDIFGNPFRPVSFDAAWNTAAVLPLAQAIYEERTFNRLPILANALEDAGCTDPDILAHCRGLGPHDRGCWVVDLLTGRS